MTDDKQDGGYRGFAEIFAEGANLIAAPVETEYGMLFTQVWRQNHAKRGDELLANLHLDMKVGIDARKVAALAALAQAHYAAANVRARP